MDKKNIILYDARENVWQSAIKDVITFGFLLICIWTSQHSTWWTFFTATLFLVYLACYTRLIVSEKRKYFYGLDELSKWVSGEQAKQTDN